MAIGPERLTSRQNARLSAILRERAELIERRKRRRTMRKKKEEEEGIRPSSHSSASTGSPTSLRSSATSTSGPTCAQRQFIYDFLTFLLCSRDRYPQCKLHDPGAVLWARTLCPLLCNDRCVVQWCRKLWCPVVALQSKVVDFPFVPQRQIPLVLPVWKTIETPQLPRWSIHLLCRSCLVHCASLCNDRPGWPR